MIIARCAHSVKNFDILRFLPPVKVVCHLLLAFKYAETIKWTYNMLKQKGRISSWISERYIYSMFLFCLTKALKYTKPHFLTGKVDCVHVSHANQQVYVCAARMLAMYEEGMSAYCLEVSFAPPWWTHILWRAVPGLLWELKLHREERACAVASCTNVGLHHLSPPAGLNSDVSLRAVGNCIISR